MHQVCSQYNPKIKAGFTTYGGQHRIFLIVGGCVCVCVRLCVCGGGHSNFLVSIRHTLPSVWETLIAAEDKEQHEANGGSGASSAPKPKPCQYASTVPRPPPVPRKHLNLMLSW